MSPFNPTFTPTSSFYRQLPPTPHPTPQLLRAIRWIDSYYCPSCFEGHREEPSHQHDRNPIIVENSTKWRGLPGKNKENTEPNYIHTDSRNTSNRKCIKQTKSRTLNRKSLAVRSESSIMEDNGFKSTKKFRQKMDGERSLDGVRAGSLADTIR